MYSRPMPRRPHIRRGAVTPLTVLCLALLVSVAALVIDGGTLLEARRHVQATADAAALAGAVDLYTNYVANQGNDVSGSAKSSALTAASDNGYTDGAQCTVTVNVPGQTYQGGLNAGKTIPPGYVEVLIQYNAPHLFSGVFGTGTSPVCARAVARGRYALDANNTGVLALNASSANTFNVTGGGGLTVNGAVQINSSNSSALNVTSSAGAKATEFILNPAMGGGGGGGGGGGLLGAILSLLGSVLSLLFGPGGSSPTVLTSLPAADPLRFLTPPDQTTLPTAPYTNLNITSGTRDLQPGVYNGGIRIGGFGTVVNLHCNADGSPGIYYLSGHNALQVSGFATLRTAPGETGGVMIYNDWSASTDSINLNTFGSVSLIAPASGLYRGLCIFQKRGTSSNAAPPVLLGGDGSVDLKGTIYAAHASVSLMPFLSSHFL
jgi:hypothetical protein